MGFGTREALCVLLVKLLFVLWLTGCKYNAQKVKKLTHYFVNFVGFIF